MLIVSRKRSTTPSYRIMVGVSDQETEEMFSEVQLREGLSQHEQKRSVYTHTGKYFLNLRNFTLRILPPRPLNGYEWPWAEKLSGFFLHHIALEVRQSPCSVVCVVLSVMCSWC